MRKPLERLNKRNFTDESVKTLLKLTKVKRLNVGATQLSDEGFRQLSAMPELKWLNVANTSIGFDVIDELKAAREGLEVEEFE